MTMTAPLDVLACPLAGLQLIEASAGTGKTWNICALYLRLLLERRFTVQQVLVVTFTNAATAELRERIRSRLVDTLAALRAPPSPAAASADPFVADLLQHLRHHHGLADAEMAQRLDAALQTFDEAAIFTIHGFCQRALADTPFAAQMPLVQTLLQDDRDLLLQAVHDVWRQRVAGDAADPALTAYLLAHGDTPARWAKLLKRQMAKPLSLPRWPADIDQASDATATAAALRQAFDAARTLWATQRDEALRTLTTGLSRLNGTTYKTDAVQAAAQGWDALLARPMPPAPGAALPDKLALLGSSLMQQRAKKDQAPPTHAFFDAAQALLNALASAERRLRLARLRLLRNLLTDGALRLRQAKREHRVVAFDDMLFNLYDRLHGGEAPGLAAALRARFPAALIDEFQDTDPLQFAVFNTVYRAGDGDADDAPPLFLVGDPKQAIYSFRHADLHTYLQARALAAGCHTLLANQRATAPLIEALNRLFGLNPQAFLQDGLHYHAVALGAKPRPLLRDDTEPRAPLQVWTLPRDARSGAPLLKPRASAAAADTCAGEIARLLDAAAQGRISVGERALRAGDIAVLVRSHAQGSVMRQALAALGVGSVELSLASVFKSPDAEELERVLAAMLEPAREGLLKAALATRWLGYDAARIEALSGDEAALSALLQGLAFHHQTWRGRGVGFMLRQWLHAEQVPARLLAQSDGPRRLTNLLHLAECLHQAEREQTSPEALLRWLQAQRDDDRGDETTQLRLESDRNLVQIVTIHKSKGLEYPIVFCPFLWDGRMPSGSDGLDGLTRHDEQGQAVIDYRAGLDADFDEALARAEARLEAAAEYMRLIYVALTRAVQRCYLVAGAYRNKSGKGSSTNEGGRALLNWLVAGNGMSPADWLSSKRKPAEPAEINAAWAALALGMPAGTLPDSLAVAPLPAARRLPLPPPDGDAARLQALPPPAQLGEAWWIGSYSALIQGATGTGTAQPTAGGTLVPPLGEPAGSDRAAADHDLRAEPLPGDLPADLPAELPEAWPAEAIDDDDILGFPRGAAAGECVHAAFEWAEFTDAATWPAAINRALRQHPPAALADDDGAAAASQAAAWAAMLQRLLGDVLNLPLPVGTAQPLRLAQVPPGRRLAELEFHLHAPRLDAPRLNATLAALGYTSSALDFPSLRGFLKGFVDLVFEHDGRYFIADWKSNHLGTRAADYSAAGLATAMAEHHYHLQYLVYSVALHRWLAARLPGYRFEQHFGGALYLFVRGVRPGWRRDDGTPAGVFFHRPSFEAITRLSALFDHHEASA
jgi:exodeoxyribonuclease V beta subunit